MNLSYWQLIRGNRNFRNLLWGQFISELGNWFNFIAGLDLVRVVSSASPTAAGVLFAARRGDDCFRFVELFFERTDVLYFAANFNRRFWHLIGKCGRFVVRQNAERECAGF